MGRIIAIDGTFASGKGTLAKRLAAHYGFAHLDTGKIYRAVAARALTSKTDLQDGKALAALCNELESADLSDPHLASGPVGAAASKIAVHQDVRAALLAFQKRFASTPPNGQPGAVLDGRDIGTVICPNADVKLYVDADPDVRAQRRYAELIGYGEDISLAQVSAQMQERDARDTGRALAPLRPADDAHLLDTTNLSIDDAFTRAAALIDIIFSDDQD